MGKLLVTFSDPQEQWLRAEADRLGLPGGVSELIRRAVDAYRKETDMPRTPSIPEDVLAKILEHRPHLRLMAENLQARPHLAAQIERDLATNYLLGETHLSPLETYRLAACSAGRAYGDY